MKPNPIQQRAIDSTADQNLLISAGAGSGKTATLTTKIYEMINRGEFTPDQLLVLTFTNNAAHEMKERTILKFNEQGSPRADEMLSCHIQTFDSFCQYLVKTYAKELGIPDQFTIMNDSVLESKKQEAIDQIFEEYYQDSIKKDRLLKHLVKFNIKDDSYSKKMVSALFDKFDTMIPKRKEEFVNSYDELFFNHESYQNLIKQAVKEDQNLIKKYLMLCQMICDHPELTEYNPESSDTFIKMIQDPCYYSYHPEIINLPSHPILDEIVGKFNEVLEYKDESFYVELKKMVDLNPDVINGHKRPRDKAINKSLALLQPLVKELIESPICDGDDYNKHYSFQEDIHLLIEMEQEVEKRVNAYERENCAYRFSDISNLALRLMTEQKYASIAEEVRQKFKYIMIDEYQDTNDIQETFINSLIRLNQKGEKAHLFCVGDAKQSIYAFRNSNVKLFLNRMEQFEQDKDESLVIPMNINYRSKHEVLNDINAIFRTYMTKASGDINYLDPSQQLAIDKDPVDPTKRDQNPYGIHRLNYLAPSGQYQTKIQAVKDECKAIIKDIKEKMENHPLVETREGKRKLQYSDFCILTTIRTHYPIYQAMFLEAGIPINVKAKVKLREVDAVILLQSLFSLFRAVLNNDYSSIPHFFASIVRSYLYEYDDDTILDLLKDNKEGKKPLYQDPVYLDFENFVKEHRDDSLSMLLQNFLTHFKVVEKLYKIGQGEDNISKLESLYQMILTKQESGESLDDVIQYFKTLKKHDIPLDSDTIYHIEDAVDMMTIHASKGLERRIVYLPLTDCAFSRRNFGDALDISDEYGILLPDYQIDQEHPSTKFNTFLRYRYLKEKSIDKPGEDEKVRLYYVALTRAIDEIYIVGNPEQKASKGCLNHKTINLYSMFDMMPYTITFYPQVQDYIQQNLLLELKDCFNYFKARPFDKDFLYRYLHTLQKKLQETENVELIKDFIIKRKAETEEKLKDVLEQKMYDHLHKRLLDNPLDPDHQYSFVYCTTSTFNEDMDQVKQEITSNPRQYYHDRIEDLNRELDEMYQYLDSADEDETSDLEASIEEIKKHPLFQIDENIQDFELCKILLDIYYYPILISVQEEYNRIVNELDIQSGLAPKKQLEKAAKIYSRYYFYYFFQTEELTYVSFANEEYPDFHEVIDIQDEMNSSSLIPEIQEPLRIEETPIEFEAKVKRRASHLSTYEDPDDSVKELLERGTHLHLLMQSINFTTRDLSFIQEERDKIAIEKILSLPLFCDVKEEDCYKELPYYDPVFDTSGSMDLVIKRGNCFEIVDYKTSNIDKPEYEDQLRTYKRNLSMLFHVKEEQIKLTLLSLLTGKTKTVE